MEIEQVLFKGALVAAIAFSAAMDTAFAQESTQVTEPPAPQAGEAPKRTKGADASSAESSARTDDAIPEIYDRDPTIRSLRFDDRRQVLLRLGFGGKFKDQFLGDSKAKPTYGVTLRWDRPVHEYVTTGLGLSFYSTKSEIEFREPAFDISLILKGRYPFEMGKKQRKFESEVYLLFQIGGTLWIDSAALDLNLIGPGWNVGLAPGYQFFINDRVGLLAEIGWIRTQAFFSRGRFNVLMNQAAVRLGAVFPF